MSKGLESHSINSHWSPPVASHSSNCIGEPVQVDCMSSRAFHPQQEHYTKSGTGRFRQNQSPHPWFGSSPVALHVLNAQVQPRNDCCLLRNYVRLCVMRQRPVQALTQVSIVQPHLQQPRLCPLNVQLSTARIGRVPTSQPSIMRPHIKSEISIQALTEVRTSQPCPTVRQTLPLDRLRTYGTGCAHAALLPAQ